jgi:hypothetical protein
MYDDEKESYLEIGKGERIYPRFLITWAIEQGSPALSRFPLVVINGCHTTALSAEELVNFVQSFASLGASAIVGTEVAVPVDFATGFALTFLRKTASTSIGEAIYQTRWEYALRGNLAGLAYTPYGLADVGLGAPNAPAAPPRMRRELTEQAPASV